MGLGACVLLFELSFITVRNKVEGGLNVSPMIFVDNQCSIWRKCVDGKSTLVSEIVGFVSL